MQHHGSQPDKSRVPEYSTDGSADNSASDLVKQRNLLLEAEIRSRAYLKWELAGCPILHSDEDRHAFWYAAEREVLERKALEAER